MSETCIGCGHPQEVTSFPVKMVATGGATGAGFLGVYPIVELGPWHEPCIRRALAAAFRLAVGLDLVERTGAKPVIRGVQSQAELLPKADVARGFLL